MEANNNYTIMVNTDWHRILCHI